MCATLTPAPKPAPYRSAARRFARWLSDTPAWNLANGLVAGLMVRVPGLTTYYWVARTETGYRLHKEREDGEPQSYDIDTTFGPEPEHHECSCPGFRFGRRRDGRFICKHIVAVHAALKAIGVPS